MPLFDHFDFLSPIYDQAIKFKDLDYWLKATLLPCDCKVLDIGGGTGRVASALEPYISQIVILDLSHGMLIQAKKKTQDCVRSYSENLCFSDATFDRIIMADAFHHIIDANRTASEMWRVLKPGGRIIIHEPDIRLPVIWLVAIAEKLALMRSRFVSPPKIGRLFAKYSNSQVHISRVGYTAWITVSKDG